MDDEENLYFCFEGCLNLNNSPSLLLSIQNTGVASIISSGSILASGTANKFLLGSSVIVKSNEKKTFDFLGLSSINITKN